MPTDEIASGILGRLPKVSGRDKALSMTESMLICIAEPNKVARIGAIITIILIVTICQFVYMNITAIPKWRDKSWHTTLSYEESVQAPALFIFRYDIDPQFTSSIECNYLNSTATQGFVPCVADLTSNATSESAQYHLFNLKDMKLNPHDYVQIQFNVTCKDGSTKPQSSKLTAF